MNDEIVEANEEGEEGWLSWLFSFLGTRKRNREEGDVGDDGSDRKRTKGEIVDSEVDDAAEGEETHVTQLLGAEKGVGLEEYAHYPFLSDKSSILSCQGSLTMVIMRGLPGSGKSSLVRQILKTYPHAEVCSADAFFTQADGSYQYDRTKIKEAHMFSQGRAEALCKDACNLVIVDNTHVKRWELQPYINTAAKFRYSVLILEPQTPWAKDPGQLAERNSHDVSENVIMKKLKEWQEIRPRYFCWQLNLADSHLLIAQVKNMLHLASMSCPNFKDWLCENDKEGEDNSEHAGSLGDRLRSRIDGYSRGFFSGSSKDLLHCTARLAKQLVLFSLMTTSRFLRKGMEIDEELYMEQSRSHRLRLVALMLTRDTFGARWKKFFYILVMIYSIRILESHIVQGSAK